MDTKFDKLFKELSNPESLAKMASEEGGSPYKAAEPTMQWLQMEAMRMMHDLTGKMLKAGENNPDPADYADAIQNILIHELSLTESEVESLEALATAAGANRKNADVFESIKQAGEAILSNAAKRRIKKSWLAHVAKGAK